MADEWTEANLVPPTMQDRIRVLLDVIEPLVQNELDGRIDTWFFGHYGDPAPYHLRVRILWRDEANANEGQRELSDSPGYRSGWERMPGIAGRPGLGRVR